MSAATDEEKLLRIFDNLDIYAASTPFYPEMLDFNLEENLAEEQREIIAYHAIFNPRP